MNYWNLLFQGGFCGIPPALVQRYSEELKKDVFEVAAVIDECRVKYLHAKSKPAVRLLKISFVFFLTNLTLGENLDRKCLVQTIY